MKKSLAAAALLALPVWAAGFRIDTQAGRAVGMGGAVAALVDDSSANFYNPAALTSGGQGFEVMLGDTLIIPQLTFTGADGVSTSNLFTISPPPHIYARAGLFDQLALGIGFYVPFGASGNWPEDWPGQYRARQSQLQAYDINVNLAYAPHRRVSFAGGVNVVRGTVYIERHLNFLSGGGEPSAVQLGGSAWGVGFNGGVRMEIIEDIMWFGGALRGSVPLNFTGRAHFEGIPQEFQSRIYDQEIKAAVTLPLNGQFGVGFKILNRLKLGLDVTYVDWSAFRELRIEFLGNEDLTVPAPKRWFDTASVHVGLEYDITSSFRARLGFVYDPTPSPADTLTPDLPDATRIKVSAGLGYAHSSGFFADLGFQFVALLSQRSTAPGIPGTYSGTAEVISLSLGYRSTSRPASEPPAPDAPPAENPAPAAPAPAADSEKPQNP